MIVTSNSVEHNYSIPRVTIVGDVDGFENVAERVEVYLNSSTTFDYTHETVVYEEPQVGVTTTITESKTVEEFTRYSVALSTAGITTSSFNAWDDLEEDQVLQWAFAADADEKTRIQNEQEAKVLEAKDKILNPRKYYRDTPVTPWQRRADEARASASE
jgi:hypothetical protein